MLAMFLVMSSASSPGNSFSPVNSSNMTAAAEKRSLRDVERVAARLLGRHVAPLAHHLARSGRRAARRSAAATAMPKSAIFTSPAREIRMFDGETSRCTTLCWCAKSSPRMISIAMWSAAGMRDQPALVLELAQQRGQVEAVDVLHRDEQRLADAAEVEDLDDVGVAQLDRDLGLGDEARLELGVARQLGQDPLDREGLLEPVRAVGLGEEHLGHAADRDAVQHLIAFGAGELSGGHGQTLGYSMEVKWYGEGRSAASLLASLLATALALPAAAGPAANRGAQRRPGRGRRRARRARPARANDR